MDVVGEIGQDKHVVVAFHLGGIGTGVAGLRISAIDERGGSVIDHFRDRGSPTNKRLNPAARVTFEIFSPRFFSRDGESTAGRGEGSFIPVAVGAGAAVGTHTHLVGGVGVQSGNHLGHGGHRAQADPVGVRQRSVFQFPKGFLITRHPVHRRAIAGDGGYGDERSYTERGGVASRTENHVVTRGGVIAVGRNGGGAVGTGILINISGGSERSRVRAPCVAACPGTRHIQHDQQEIVGTIVFKRRGEIEGVQAGVQLLRSVENQLCT